MNAHVAVAVGSKARDGTSTEADMAIKASLHKAAHAIRQLQTVQRSEAHQRAAKDLYQLQLLQGQWRTQHRLLLTGLEAVSAVINPQLRKQMLTSRLLSRVLNDNEANITVEKHRDDFQTFLWKRKTAVDRDTKRIYEMSQLFRLGEEVSWSCSERIRNFYVNNVAHLCKDAISWAMDNPTDIILLFAPRVTITAAPAQMSISIKNNGLSFEIIEPADEDAKLGETDLHHLRTMSESEFGSRPATASSSSSPRRNASTADDSSTNTRTPVLDPRPPSATSRANSVSAEFSDRRSAVAMSASINQQNMPTPRPSQPTPIWGRAYATIPLSYSNRMSVKSAILDTIGDMYIFQDDMSAYLLVARILDLVHGTHGLQSSLLVNPRDAVLILRKKLTSLGYEVADFDDGGVKSEKLDVFRIVELIQTRLLAEMRLYFEFTVNATTEWLVGVWVENKDHGVPEYPGSNAHSMGFCSDGTIHWDGVSIPYQTRDADAPQAGTRTVGIMMDMKWFALHMVEDGTVHPAAFGNGAEGFNNVQVQAQMELMRTQPLLPFFALKTVNNGPSSAALSHDASRATSPSVYDKPVMHVNFGNGNYFSNTSHTFAFPIENVSIPYDSLAARSQPRSYTSTFFSTDIPIQSASATLATLQQQQAAATVVDEAAMADFFKASLIKDPPKSFSQFPPTTFRKSLAASIIQRAWRRRVARRIRQRIKMEQYAAACIIQRLARRWLAEFNAKRDVAAALIQRNWRKTLFFKYALIRCRYQIPLSMLHKSASLIQRSWRITKARRVRIPDARLLVMREAKIRAKTKIVLWWTEMKQRKLQRRKRWAVIDIQRCWRGYQLRKMLRSDLRVRLMNLGASVARHRHELLRVRAVLMLQSAWRAYRVRKIAHDSNKIRHKAATRIQAAFKGYWVRRHIHLRFTYGESVFLAAVCRALRNCHYILRAYRPCALVPV
ncbi:hypothetical protein SeMB42_g05767 [Synchytrium endobioticum]|uniref:B30.2/SPRY domain-containing protein n=1 Tax=Synchytrium endobioticum TaxID=286115 RepID=A0A507CPG1_9FUNG|nr:hypothetical protein SeMB42_g05767 [Synchytrium endobioticum]